MIQNLLLKIEQYNPNVDVKQIIKAYNFTESAHEGQLRNSGERYFVHPYNVAMILADLNMDATTIVAGLLYNIIGNTGIFYNIME